MILNRPEVRRLLEAFDLATLFLEVLGWDRHREHLDVHVDETRYGLDAVAQKRGMVAFRLVCDTIPNHPTRRKVERRVARTHHEHILVYIDRANTRQVWQWVRREIGRPMASREISYRVGQTGEPLIERLQHISFSLEDEEQGLTIVDVTGRVRAAFDAEAVTRRFYDHFQREHRKFHGFISGITDRADRDWYASLMLNRLMFVYFVQKRGFLDSDYDYLRVRLRMIQQERGENEFLTFYRHFLLKLFHQGLGTPSRERDPDMNRYLGRIPYINGGLFLPHPLEAENPDIHIPDKAFEKIFDFFDEYRWHLDERPVREADNEINPEVIGHIFEKYINQKDLGAYYTGEDITGYIANSTIVPYLLDRIEAGTPNVLHREAAGWDLLAEDPDRYLAAAMKHKVHADLPKEITSGLDDPGQRDAWNQLAGENHGLPNETWRELVERRHEYARITGLLRDGHANSSDDLVTLNLDARQFLQDAIEGIDDPDDLVAVWRMVTTVRVLDPTCGSGAFLFAALDVLDPIYEALIDRMTAMVADRPTAADLPNTITKVLTEMARHPSRRFFVLRSIVIANLYGVDIMREAVEIAKLRLFLKLIAQTERFEDVRPLPDIDFNIRAGNTLVGYATESDLRRSVEGRLNLSGDTLVKVEEQAMDTAIAYDAYKEEQATGTGGEAMLRAKNGLRTQLATLCEELDRYLATEYDIWKAEAGDHEFEEWRDSHQPFHWFAEFYGPISAGGFDVVIGNPPYVEYRNVDDYTIRSYETEPCGNLYAYVAERSLRILNPHGRLGLIIPVASVCTDRYVTLQRQLHASGNLWISSFNDRPSKLFEGLEHIRLAIVLVGKQKEQHHVWTTKYNRWLSTERPFVFERLRYADVTEMCDGPLIPKLGSDLEVDVMSKLLAQDKSVGTLATGGRHAIRYTRKLSWFVQVLDFVPEIFTEDGTKREPSELKTLSFPDEITRDAVLAVLNSNLFYWYLTAMSDVRNLNKRDVLGMPFNPSLANDGTLSRLSELSGRLMEDFREHSEFREMNYAVHGKLRIQCILPRESKPIIDEIDAVLADHYGMSGEEVDFIVNHDSKYRVGADDPIEV